MDKYADVRKDKKLGISLQSSNGLKKYIFGATIDELIDGLELLKDGEFVNEFICRFTNLSEEQLVRLDVLMTKTNNAEEMLKYARKRENLSNAKEFEEALANLRDYYVIVLYAQEFKVHNIDKLVDVVCKGDNALAMKEIAKVEGADLEKIKKAIFQTKKVFAIIEFCLYCQQKADDIITPEEVERVEQLAIDSKSAFCIRVCASKVKGVNIARLQEEFENAEDSNLGFEIRSFARDVKGADIDKLRKAIKNTKDSYYYSEFIKEFGPEPTSKKSHWFSKK